DAGERVAGGEVGVLLDGRVGAPTRIGNGTGRRGQRDRVGGFGKEQRRGEPIHRIAAVATTTARLGSGLAVHHARVAPVLLRVDLLDQPLLAGVGGQWRDFAVFGGVAERPGRAFRALELADGFGDVHLGGVPVGPG